MKYAFSSEGLFYPLILKDAYIASGRWPVTAIEVDESVFLEFIAEPPEGKTRGVGQDGMPAWVDAPPPVLISDSTDD